MFRSLLLLLSLPFADGYAMAGPSCEEFLADEVCALHFVIGPSPAEINGSSVYIGDYVDTYEIMELPADGSVTADDILSLSVNYSEYLTTGLIIEVTRYSAGGCEVTINGDACAACEICGANFTVISVDCSVVPDGRVVECEPLENVFLPMEGYTFAEGEVSDNPPLTTDGEVSELSAESPEGSASPQPMALLVISGVVAVSTMILDL